MLERKRICIVLIIVSTLLITVLHYVMLGRLPSHVVLEELYYIPLFLGALNFGLKGGLVTYLFVSVCYLPFFFGQWTTTFLDYLDRGLHLLFSGVFVFIAGFLVDWNQRRMKQIEKDRYLTGLGEAATTIVHDLRNPLISILGFAKRIKENKGDLQTAAESIIDSAQNMQRMVDGVLDFARPIQLELKEEDVSKIVRQACDLCKMKAEERGVMLSTEVSGGAVIARIDGFNLQRAIINLINNAIEASVKGQRVVVCVEPKGHDTVVRVKDSGSGMDKETLENIFIPFYSKKHTGTGLGMAIVKKIIDGHQGKIHIKSRPHMGTEVRIELPCRLE